MGTFRQFYSGESEERSVVTIDSTAASASAGGESLSVSLVGLIARFGLSLVEFFPLSVSCVLFLERPPQWLTRLFFRQLTQLLLALVMSSSPLVIHSCARSFTTQRLSYTIKLARALSCLTDEHTPTLRKIHNNTKSLS